MEILFCIVYVNKRITFRITGVVSRYININNSTVSAIVMCSAMLKNMYGFKFFVLVGAVLVRMIDKVYIFALLYKYSYCL